MKNPWQCFRLPYLRLSGDLPPGEPLSELAAEEAAVVVAVDGEECWPPRPPWRTEPRPRWIRSVRRCSSKRLPNFREPLVVRNP